MKYKVQLTDPWFTPLKPKYETVIDADTITEARSKASRWANKVSIPGYKVTSGDWQLCGPLYCDKTVSINPYDQWHVRELQRPPGRNDKRDRPHLEMWLMKGDNK